MKVPVGMGATTHWNTASEGNSLPTSSLVMIAERERGGFDKTGEKKSEKVVNKDGNKVQLSEERLERRECVGERRGEKRE